MSAPEKAGTDAEPAPAPDAGVIGERIERLLDEIEQAGDQVARERTEDLVALLMRFYGTGLERIVELLRDTEDGERLHHELADDHLIRGLFVLHDLHPRTTVERVTAALDEVRPYLGSHAGDVELLGIDASGIVRLRLKGTCDGCPSSTVTVKYAIDKAVRAAAPEITDIDVAGLVAEDERTGPGGRPLLPLDAVECPVPETP